jgi:hypothetical protein
MNATYMIDSVVQHTTVLIAQLATSAGVRAPLAHVAGRVFVDLVKEIERQGVSRKVVADMFGLALRSYQQKVQRLAESSTDRGRTLWEAVYDFLRQKEVATRSEVMLRFRGDDHAIVKSVLQDLVESGLVYKTGARHGSVYRIAPEEDLVRAPSSASLQAALWFRIYREGPLSKSELVDTAQVSNVELDRALAELASDGRIHVDQAGSEPKFASSRCFIEMSNEEAWAPSVVNHFQMMTSAICAKLANGQTRALPDDELGGSSYSFNVWQGHPAEARVRGLLRKFRADVGELWDEVAAHNAQQAALPPSVTRVNFYFGQALIQTPNEQEP